MHGQRNIKVIRDLW